MAIAHPLLDQQQVQRIKRAVRSIENQYTDTPQANLNAAPPGTIIWCFSGPSGIPGRSDINNPPTYPVTIPNNGLSSIAQANPVLPNPSATPPTYGWEPMRAVSTCGQGSATVFTLSSNNVAAALINPSTGAETPTTVSAALIPLEYWTYDSTGANIIINQVTVTVCNWGSSIPPNVYMKAKMESGNWVIDNASCTGTATPTTSQFDGGSW